VRQRARYTLLIGQVYIIHIMALNVCTLFTIGRQQAGKLQQLRYILRPITTPLVWRHCTARTQFNLAPISMAFYRLSSFALAQSISFASCLVFNFNLCYSESSQYSINSRVTIVNINYSVWLSTVIVALSNLLTLKIRIETIRVESSRSWSSRSGSVAGSLRESINKINK